MFTKYNEYELIELFGNEPTYISGKEAGMAMYSTVDGDGVNIILSISAYEKECYICLCLKERLLFEISLDHVEYLATEGSFLRIHQSNSNHLYCINFYPNIFIKADKN